MKQILLLLIPAISFAQVGINKIEPEYTLEIRENKINGLICEY